MNRQLQQLSAEELKKLLRRETKAFIEGLENGITVAELQSIRASMKEISEILEERNKPKGDSNK